MRKRWKKCNRERERWGKRETCRDGGSAKEETEGEEERERKGTVGEVRGNNSIQCPLWARPLLDRSDDALCSTVIFKIKKKRQKKKSLR